MSVIPFKSESKLYSAKAFKADTMFGEFKSSGTLCGHIDFVVPLAGTYALLADEVLNIAVMLLGAREDVLNNSNPLHDPRIVERG